MEYAVTVYGKRGFYCGANFRDEKKARDYYAEMLVRYPDKKIKIIKVMKRFEEFELDLDVLIEDYPDLSYEEMADALEFQASSLRAKASRES